VSVTEESPLDPSDADALRGLLGEWATFDPDIRGR